jgi:hypothetical protein
VLPGIATNAVASPLESTGMAVAVRVKATTREHGTAISAMIFFDPRSIQFDINGDQYNGAVQLVLA